MIQVLDRDREGEESGLKPDRQRAVVIRVKVITVTSVTSGTTPRVRSPNTAIPRRPLALSLSASDITTDDVCIV